MLIAVVMLEPYYEIVWPIKHEVRLTIIIILKSVRNISRKKKNPMTRSGGQKKKKVVKPAIKGVPPCLVLVCRLVCVYCVVSKLHS